MNKMKSVPKKRTQISANEVPFKVLDLPKHEPLPEEINEEQAELPVQEPISTASLEEKANPDPVLEEVISNEELPKAKHNFWANIKQKSIKTESLPEQSSDLDTEEAERKTHMINEFGAKSTVNDKNAVISMTMVVTGDIKLDTSLYLAGKVIGNIDCQENIEICEESAVEGNITAGSVKLIGGEIKGDITCQEDIETNENTKITGNLSAKTIIISGTITGEIRAKEAVSLTKTAIVKGDLFSTSISIEKGAVLEGKYSVIGLN